MDCQFCNKTFSSKSAVTHHQKTAKYCLHIQGKNRAEKEYKCECGKILTSKHNHEVHIKNCTVRDHIIYLEKRIEYLEKFEERTKDLEGRIKDLEERNKDLEGRNKDLEKLLIEKDNVICTLRGSIDVYKEDHGALIDIAKQPKNNTTTNNNNKVLNIKTSFDFEDKTQLENALSNYNLDYFLDGQKGLARFLADNILRDEENNYKYLCTDLGRAVFKYRDKLGNIQKDYEAKRLTNYLVEGGIKEKATDISEEWIGKDSRVDKTKIEIALEKNSEVNGLDKNNQIFKKELASIVAI
jgi:hypothetical protein